MTNLQRVKKFSIEPDDGYCEDRDYNNRPWESWEEERDRRARSAYPGLFEHIEKLIEEGIK